MSSLMRTPFAETPPPKGVPGKWQPKFVEEFNHGLGPKFASGWPPSAAVTPPMGASEVACYDPACVTVENSVCTLSAIAKTQEVAGVVYHYATGVISTPAEVFAPGDFVESRVWIPGQNHPGIWTSAPAWPSGGEDDIAEEYAGQMTYHFHSPSGAPGGPVPGNWTDGWHVFGSLYGESNVSDYYDGRLVGTAATDGVRSPEWLIASIMLDGSAPLVVPSQMHLDWVRVFFPS